MGFAFSCPEGEDEAFNDSFEALLYERSNLRSLSFNGCNSEPSPKKAFESMKFVIEGSVNFKTRGSETFQLEIKIFIKSSEEDKTNNKANPLKRSRSSQEALDLPQFKPGGLKNGAALKLQKLYRSFRTRRQLADCAVLLGQRWWKLLDFVLLKRSSVSFFDIEKPESIVSKWSRARTRAAKVGKGLSKNGKARKLAIQHWLEAIDPRHRYGHNLQFYYECWLRFESNQPFFYWLDVGEGKEVNLNECLRSTLQQQCIRYLGPKERGAYEVIVERGKLFYKKSREYLDTTRGPVDSKWIFVLSTQKNLYVGLKMKGMFQHSSFLAGGATSAAGRIVVEKGILKAVWAHSGHYRPTEENFEEFMSFLKENNVDLSDVKQAPDEDDIEWGSRVRSHPSEPDLINRNAYSQSQLEETLPLDTPNDLDLKADCEQKQEIIQVVELEKLYRFNERRMAEEQEDSCRPSNHSYETLGQSTAGSSLNRRRFGFQKPNLFLEQDDITMEPMPKEEILQRLGTKSCSFQSTQVPDLALAVLVTALQFRAIEQVSSSPRGSESSKHFISPEIHEAQALLQE